MSTDVAVPAGSTGLARPDFVSQATAVEQARAVAEVEAAVVVAQRCPRDVAGAVAAMRESCAQKALADRAFFRFPRGKETVTGPSIHIARELARVWGNVQYGIRELRRDDTEHYSEMQAWAWDVQTNTRSESTFVAPHKRDTKRGVVDLTDLRDIYESNANQGARRVREAIFAILPTWFVEEAKERCTATLRDGGGKSLAQQAADIVRAFGEFGVSADQLEQRIGRPASRWTDHDLAALRVIGASLRQGTIRVEDEFATDRVTLAEVTATPAPNTDPLHYDPAEYADAEIVEES